MKILALETSSECASLALLLGDAVFECQLPGTGAGHSAAALPALRELLRQADVRIGDLDVVAFGAGPGAFTGLRLACSVAQGLAVAADLPVAPICSLRALASQFDAPRIYCAMDARMSEAYVAGFERQGDALIEVMAAGCLPPDQVPVPDVTGWCGVGTAFRAYPLISERLQANVQAHAPNAVPTALAVARLARDRSLWIDPALAAPRYVRDKVAQTTVERLASGGRA